MDICPVEKHDVSGEPAGGASIWRLVSKRTREIVAITPAGTSPAFYCIHSVAGDVTGYYELARALGPECTFYGIQVQKKDMNASFVQSIECLSERYVEALIKFQPDGPMLIGGFSAGALIALEVAQRLRELGRDVPLLVALDGAPSNTDAGLKAWMPAYIYQLFKNGILLLNDLQPRQWTFRSLGARLFERIVCRTRLRIPMFRRGQTIDVMAMLNVLDRPGWQTEYQFFMRAMYEAMYAYVPKPYDGRVVVYEIERQPPLHLRQIGAVWRHLAKDCEIVRLKGLHGRFFVDETLGPLASHFRQVLMGIGSRESVAQGSVEPKKLTTFQTNAGTGLMLEARPT